MQECEQYQQQIWQDPFQLGAEILAHCDICPTCNKVYQEALAFEQQLADAMNIEAPAALKRRVMRIPKQQRYRQIGWVTGILLLFASFFIVKPIETSFSEQVIPHIEGELSALTENNRPSSADMGSLFTKLGLSFSGDTSKIVFAEHCPMLSRFAAHLVMQGEKGRVTLLVMPDEIPSDTQMIQNQRFQGEVLAMPYGNMAIVGERGEQLTPFISWAKQAIAKR